VSAILIKIRLSDPWSERTGLREESTAEVRVDRRYATNRLRAEVAGASARLGCGLR